ncbi:MAG: hypothetical protein JW830_03405 [Bacteroidales bacterium]|nr:hypothetical protein [Bacteroidales bacterium]
MKYLLFPVLVICVIMLAPACYYDSEEYLYPQLGNPCDTSNVTFGLSVQPLLQSYCYGCHSNSNSSLGGNIRLEDYADVKIHADDGSLYGSISHSGGFSPMPMGAAKLQDCNLALVQKWIDTGAPNN